MWWLMSDGSDHYSRCLRRHHRKTIFTNAQLPNRFYVFPRRYQADQNLSVASLSSRFVFQVLIDRIKDSLMLTNPQSFQVISNAFNVFDLVHLFQSPIGNRQSQIDIALPNLRHLLPEKLADFRECGEDIVIGFRICSGRQAQLRRQLRIGRANVFVATFAR